MTVSKKSLANLKAIKKGEVRNPNGARAHKKFPAKFKKLTYDEVVTVGELILQNNVPALIAISKDPNATVLKVWVASVAARAIKHGDAAALNILLDRFIGKVPSQLLLHARNAVPEAPVDLSKLSNQELKELEHLMEKTTQPKDK